MCKGAGLVRSAEATGLFYLRKIWMTLVQKKPSGVKVTVSLDVANYLLNCKRNDLAKLEERFDTAITVEASQHLLPHEGTLEFTAREPAPQP